MWSEPAHWADPGLVVVRSCWDYHLRLAEFEAWLAGLAAPPCATRRRRSAGTRASATCSTSPRAADLAYARVDALPEAAPRLMELELIAPALFLAHDAGAAGRLADALLDGLTNA